jgi:hypothetical protein
VRDGRENQREIFIHNSSDYLSDAYVFVNNFAITLLITDIITAYCCCIIQASERHFEKQIRCRCRVINKNVGLPPQKLISDSLFYISVIVSILVVALIFVIFIEVLSYRLIKGTKNASSFKFSSSIKKIISISRLFKRDHIKIRPYTIFLGVLAIIMALPILTFTARGITSGIVNGLVYGYIFICMYSLYVMIKSESESSFNRQAKV